MGMRPYKTDSAFILVEIDKGCGHTAGSLKDVLVRDHSILIRDASDFWGLDSSFIRLAIKDSGANEAWIEALRSIFGKENL